MKISRYLIILVSVIALFNISLFSVCFGQDKSSKDEENDLYGEETIIYDPFQPFNKVFFTFNDKLYFWFLKPVGTVYKTFIPTGIRQGISNAFFNVRMPVRFFNNLFQGKPESAAVEVERFLINTTLGLGGFFDMAKSHFNMKAREEDFGQTLGVYQVGQGPYIVWPFLGPSTVRDSAGMVVDIFLDPLTYVIPDFIIKAGVKGGEITNSVSLKIGEYEDIKASALDPYISIRDAYIQNREKKIKE